MLGSGHGALSQLWAHNDDAGFVQSGPLVTTEGFAHAPARVAYGTADGRYHLRNLYTGEPVGPERGILLRDSIAASDSFTGYADGAVMAVEAPSPFGEYGQLWVVYNDDDSLAPGGDPAEATDDVALAQIDISTGQLIRDVPVPGTDKYTISSSPLLIGPDPAGKSQLIFTIVNSEAYGDDYKLDDNRRNSSPQIVRIPIADAGRNVANPDLANLEMATVRSANPLASPTLIGLDDQSGDTATKSKLYAAAGTADPAASFTLFGGDDLATTVSSPRLDQAASDTHPFYTQTPAVAPGTDGLTPGLPGATLTRPGAIYVATYDVVADTTTVHRIVAGIDGATLVEASRSKAYPGRPAPQLALTKPATGPGTQSGKVILSTAKDMVALKGSDLSPVWRLNPKGDTSLSNNSAGFHLSSPTIANGTIYATRDNGTFATFDAETGKPVDNLIPADLGGVEKGGRPAGSPAIGSGVLVVSTIAGVAALSNACANPVYGNNNNETLPGTVAGDDIKGFGGLDKASTLEGDDCADGGAGDDYLDGGTGNDDLDGNIGEDTVLGRAGNDTLRGGNDADTILGDDGDDVMDGGYGNDLIKGAAGNDKADGADGADTITGGDGDDTLEGGPGNDRIKGGAGNDIITGGAGRDRLDGGLGNDTIDSGRNGGVIFAGPGDDTITSANGKRDEVHCSAGVDSVVADRGDTLVLCESVSYRKVHVAPKRPKAKKKGRRS